MELIDNFDESQWIRGTEEHSVEEFNEYRLMKVQPSQPEGSFSYAIFDTDGTLKKVKLDGGRSMKRDPLYGVGLAMMRLSPDETHVMAVSLEGDMVLNKSYLNYLKKRVPIATNASVASVGSVVG